MKFSHLFQLQSRLCRNTKRSLIILPLAIPLLTACENILPEAVEQLTTQPQAHHSEGKTSVYVRGIETEKDLIVVDLLAINAHDRKIELSDKHDPLVLVDSQGNEYTAAKQEISLQPYTSNNLKIAFLEDELGNKYSFVPLSSGNLEIPTLQTVSGVLKFGGRVPESVNNLTLYLNNQGSDKDNTDRPKIVVANLPITPK